MVINAHLLAVIGIIVLISLVFFAKKKLKDLTYGIGLGMESFLFCCGLGLFLAL